MFGCSQPEASGRLPATRLIVALIAEW